MKEGNAQAIIYEHAIQEQLRVCLKTEQFLKRIDDMLTIDSPWAAENLARAVVDIMVLFDRTDIKAKLSKQLRELAENLKQHLSSAYCDKAQTEELIQYLETYQQFVLNTEGRFLEALREDSLLKTIKQCLQHPSGPCSHEAPAMHHWINQPYAMRSEAIEIWLQCLNPIRSIVTVILHILRGSVTFTQKTAHEGQYSQNLKMVKDCQLVRIKLSQNSEVYPMISAGRQSVNIRFLQVSNNKSAVENIPFELCLCH